MYSSILNRRITIFIEGSLSHTNALLKKIENHGPGLLSLAVALVSQVKHYFQYLVLSSRVLRRLCCWAGGSILAAS